MYLYVKTHATGLKYLGKTVGDPYKYKGSGTHWLRHLRKYGEEHTTEILLETDDKELFREKALYYSNLYNVVESKEWANIVPEQGDGGDTSMSPAYQEAMKIRDRSGNKNPFYGKKHTEEYKRKMSETKIGQGLGIAKNHGDKIKAFWEDKDHANKGATPWNKGKIGLQKQSVEQLLKKSKPIVFQNIEYISINEASRQTGISAYKIKKECSYVATSK
jgi:hypothetical protein